MIIFVGLKLHPTDFDQSYIKISDKLHPNKNAQDSLKVTSRGFVNDCKVWCFSQGDDTVKGITARFKAKWHKPPHNWAA